MQSPIKAESSVMATLEKLLVLHISPSYKPAYCYGGPIMSVAKLCEELHKAGIKTQVLTTLANGDSELALRSGGQEVVDGVKVTYYERITKDHTHFSPALLVALHALIKNVRKRDEKLVIHVHSWWNLVAILSTALAIFHRVPVVVSPRGMITNYTLSFRNTFAKYMIHKFIGRHLLGKSHIHATTVQEAANIGEHLLRTNLTIIPNLVELPDFGTCKKHKIINHQKTNYGHPETIETMKAYDPSYYQYEKINTYAGSKIRHVTDDCPSEMFERSACINMLFFSRIDKKKGLELLLTVLPHLSFNWKLSIAGTGDEAYIRDLKQLSISLSISPNISWLGQVNKEEKYEILAKHDVMVLLSSNENFANVVIESLAVGTPVLISDCVGLSTYIQESGLGWVCSLQVAEVLQTLNSINKDLITRYQIRRHAPEKIGADFSAGKIIKDYIQLYGTAASAQ